MFENTPMKHIPITEDTTIDWNKDYGVYALDADSMVFEPDSDICANDNLVIHIFDDGFYHRNDDKFGNCDEYELSDDIRHINYYDNRRIQFYLYSFPMMHLVGFVSIGDCKEYFNE